MATKEKLERTLIIIPVYEEEGVLRGVLKELSKLSFPHVLFVNDGSQDGTKELLEKHGHNVISHPINRGQGAAIQTGFDVALEENMDYVVTIDGDGQFSMEDILPLCEELWKDEFPMVIGNRFMNKANKIPFLRRLYNRIASVITFLLSGKYVGDSQSGFKGLHHKAFSQIEINSSGYEFCSEMIRESAFRHLKITEVPVGVRYTKESLGKGQNFAGGIKTVFKLVIRSLMR